MTSKQTNMHEQNYFNGSSTKLSKAETNRNGGARRSDGAGKLVKTSNKTDALQLDKQSKELWSKGQTSEK